MVLRAPSGLWSLLCLRGGGGWGYWGGGVAALPPPCLSFPMAGGVGGILGGLSLVPDRPPPPKLAHAIRLLLEYTETPYEDKLYSCGEGEGGRD